METITEEQIWEKIKGDLKNKDWKLERDDIREISIYYSSKLPNQTCSELLGNADKIYNWLNEKAPE